VTTASVVDGELELLADLVLAKESVVDGLLAVGAHTRTVRFIPLAVKWTQVARRHRFRSW